MRKRAAICTFVLAVAGYGQTGSPSQTPASQTDAAGPANSAEPSGPPTIRVGVEEVIVPVTVTDPRGRFISNLEQKDFTIFEDNKPQKIEYFSRERAQPVVVGFLLDLSNTSRAQWKNFQTAATELVLTLLPGKDQFAGYLIGYGNKAELMVNTTTDPEAIVNKIRDLKPGGGAALYDSIYIACTNRALIKGEPIEPRRILIVIGDGNDNASAKTLAQVLEVAQKNLVTIYGISTSAYGTLNEGDENLVKLAEETGGRVEYPLQDIYKDVQGFASVPSDEGNFAFHVGSGGFASAMSSAIFHAIANIAGEVTTQYILRYIPEGNEQATRSFRDLNVKVALPDVKVRARKGYYPNTP
jgi:Ca-activated chloride channel family protein